MIHVINPALLATDARGHVHFWQEEAPAVLCNRMTAFYHVGSRRLLKVVEVDDDVDCYGCRKAMEMVVRTQLGNLSPKGLEKVQNLIASMRNGELVA